GPDGARRYALAVDVASATVEVGAESELLCERTNLDRLNWVDEALAPGAPVLAQASAHGHPRPAVYEGTGLVWESPERRVAPGQTVALYRDDAVLGAGVGA
ncbi:MAG: aminomethyltransferase beta-barrel domain-containing protein, partial [Acidimicrobiales bacterium]